MFVTKSGVKRIGGCISEHEFGYTEVIRNQPWRKSVWWISTMDEQNEVEK